LRFGGVTPFEDVEGVSFDRWVLVWVLVCVLVWVPLGSPFELPAICGNPPFVCELSEGGVDGVACGDADADAGSLSSGRGFNVDALTLG
jgi:hypothetical protein